MATFHCSELRRLINGGVEGHAYVEQRGEAQEAPIFERGGGQSSSPPASHSPPPPGAQQNSPESSPPHGEQRQISPTSSPPSGPPNMTSVTEPTSVQQVTVQQDSGYRGTPKFDPTKIRTYAGANSLGDRSRYESRPLPWCRQFVRCAKPQGIRPENYVVCALLCVTTEIAARYEREQMRPAEAPSSVQWEQWSKISHQTRRRCSLTTLSSGCVVHFTIRRTSRNSGRGLNIARRILGRVSLISILIGIGNSSCSRS